MTATHTVPEHFPTPAEARSPWIPMAVEARYAPPRATIDPDTSKTWLRRAMPIVKAHKATFITAMVMSAFGLVLQVQIPQLLGQDALTNSIILHKVPIEHYVIIVAILAGVAGVAGFISRLFLMTTAYKIEFDLRNIIYEHLSRMSFPFYDKVQSGQLISRANSDIRSVQMYLTFAPNILVQCGIALVAFVYMLRINVPLALVAMSTMPFIYVLGVRMRKSMFPVSWLIQSRLADVATIVDENINGVRVVKSFAAEGQQLRSLAKAADRLQWSYIKDADLRAKFTPAVQNLSQLGLAMVLLFGGYLVLHHEVQVGAILSFSFWIVMLQAPFQMLGMLIMMGQRASASSQRIYEILDQPPTIFDRPGSVDLVDCRGDVHFDHVTFSYNEDGAKILDNFELHMKPGETVALVGRTGSGKSTVARVLPRFYDVDGGAVMIDGHDVRDLTLDSLRANIGIVLDEPFLFSMSVRDNIAYGRPEADFADIVAVAQAAGADEFIRELSDGYNTVVGERGYTLSGGQRQRIAIARTLLVNPPILVLDDATSAIDVQVELRIHDGLRRLMEGRTTLIIAHRLSTISLADRVLLMDEGRIVADGTHAELMATVPLYVEVLAQAEEEEAAHVAEENEQPRLPANGRGEQPQPVLGAFDPGLGMNGPPLGGGGGA
ncbi:MAG TPA: ABC transporter ATP-binding protein [Acidimicrobiales bacterium]|nr:ABC transporter ATP-binding protein [Acidimicrobiales bacterium]